MPDSQKDASGGSSFNDVYPDIGITRGGSSASTNGDQRISETAASRMTSRKKAEWEDRSEEEKKWDADDEGEADKGEADKEEAK
ncbi:hypothetical protein P7C73_g585, partial [Tremellales sp. Uapishka_1]